MTNCSICLDILSDPYETLCKHTFHKDCLDKWVEESDNGTCPLCRQCLGIIVPYTVPVPNTYFMPYLFPDPLFRRSPDLSFPLIFSQYHELRVNFTLNNIELSNVINANNTSLINDMIQE